jgi:hypothetical protein
LGWPLRQGWLLAIMGIFSLFKKRILLRLSRL